MFSEMQTIGRIFTWRIKKNLRQAEPRRSGGAILPERSARRMAEATSRQMSKVGARSGVRCRTRAKSTTPKSPSRRAAKERTPRTSPRTASASDVFIGESLASARLVSPILRDSRLAFLTLDDLGSLSGTKRLIQCSRKFTWGAHGRPGQSDNIGAGGCDFPQSR